ncbi:hypothetical protein PsW64_02077 [Pseudovibrio sp. W64]|nr:hypothetical protein PsW64_02077 [Pseudovibrio sp. W64]
MFFACLRANDGEWYLKKNLSPLSEYALILIPCPRDGQLADRPSACRGLGGAFERGNASFKGPVEPIFRRDCMV